MEITRKVKVSYGIGAVGKDMVYAFVSGFLMYYYNTVLGISATFIGVLFMAARIFDACNDPFMGVVVEKTHSRFGRFRPWLFIGTVLNAIVLYGMYAVPRAMTGTNLLIYVSIAYVLWGVTYTIMDIPYWSMIPAITTSGKGRETITVIARSCAGVGFAIPTALTMTLVRIFGHDDDRLGFRILSGIIGIFFILALLVTVKNVKEKTELDTKAVRIKDMFSALLHNDQAIVVVVSIVLYNASLYLTQNLAIYFFRYDIGNGELFGLFSTVGGAAQILAMMMVPVFRKKLERAKIFLGALGTTILGYGFLFVLGALHITNLILLCISAIIIFIGLGMATVLTTIFLADTVDYGEWKNKQRNESVTFSLQTFVVKLASAFSVLIAGVGLDLFGFNEASEVQSDHTLLGIRMLMIIVPIIGLLLSILIFKRKYKLTDDYLNQIMAEVNERRMG
jgi:melibiose permease